MTEEHVFLAALDLPNAAARSAYLDEVCGKNSELRQQVELLLAAHFRSGEFLDVPAPRQVTMEAGMNQAVTIDSNLITAAGHADDPSDVLEFLSPSARPDSLGRLGRYEVLQVLGKGGFGIVLRAFDDVLQRIVAIKVMAPQMAATSPARKRFLREAQSSAQVRHENVVQVYEVGEQPLPYLVMEFIPGETLQQRLDRLGPLEVLEALQIGRQIAEGLAAAHAMDLIHRDIKPGNVLLEGSQLKVKITDFGLARAADDASMTQSGQIAGTPMYMAPEQALGETLDQRTDLFSFGSVMYQMVTGRPPFRASTAVAALRRVVDDTPRPIGEIIPETPQWLCDIIGKLHAKKREERYQSAREVADVLADCEAQLKVYSKLEDYSRIPRASAKDRSGGSRTWAIAAASLVLVPLISLAVTELVGVTHLFRGRQATPDSTKSAGDRAPVSIGKSGTPIHIATSEPPLAIAPFSDADAARIAALPLAEQVEEFRRELVNRNPGFDGTVTPTIENDFVTGVEFFTNHVSDISPVRAFPRLTSLNCRGEGSVLGMLSDLKPLRGMQLVRLTLSVNPVSDLTPLIGMPLADLHIDNSHVTDLSPLEGMQLKALNCSYTKVSSLAPLQGMPLVVLWCNHIGITDLAPIKGAPLEWITIHETQIADLSPLRGMPLKQIYVDFERDRDEELLRSLTTLQRINDQPVANFWKRYGQGEFYITPFTDADVQRVAALPVTEQVEEVRQAMMRLNPGFDGKITPTIEKDVVIGLKVLTDEVVNIAPLRAFAGLTSLDLRGTYLDKGKLSDLSPLKGLSLTWLDCSSTQISDLTPLADMPLTFLAFNHNPVTDLSPLKNMPLETLGIAQTKVTDLSPLKGLNLKTLGAQLLPITDLSPLAGMPLTGLDLYHTTGVTSLESLRGTPLEGLNLHDVPVSDLSPLAGMTTLRSLQLEGNPVSDLTPLAGLKLTDLLIRDKQVTDLSPLVGMPLVRLHIYGTGVSDVTPLKGMPLQEVRLTPRSVTQGLDVLREIKSLQTIGIDGRQAWPPAEFWERYDKGEFTK